VTEGRVKMRILKGIPASGGVAIGKGFFLNRVLPRSVRSTVGRDQVDEEVAAFRRALDRSREQILLIRDGVADTSSQHHQILSVHLALLEDSMLVEETVRMIRDNQFAADWAFNKVLQNLLETFHRMVQQVTAGILDDHYLAYHPVEFFPREASVYSDPIVFVYYRLAFSKVSQ